MLLVAQSAVTPMIRRIPAFAVLLAASGMLDAGTDRERIADLEARIKLLEAEAVMLKTRAEQASAAAESARTAIEELKNSQTPAKSVLADTSEPEGDAHGAHGANAFNPELLLVLNGSYQSHSLDPAIYRRSGFTTLADTGPNDRGFTLGGSELSLSSNIDDKFFGQMTVAFRDDGTRIMEAYIETLTLPKGFSLRAGRFFSNIGALNSRHTHTDAFYDRPLPYQSLLANQYRDDGMQVRWVAPTDLYVELGAEIFAGNRFPAGGGAGNSIGSQTLFAHIGGDIGAENAWLAGVSMLDADTDGNEEGFSGDARLYIADATWKWAPQGNFKDGGFTLRGEYFLDQRDGVFTDPDNTAITALWNGNRRGAYLEGIYRFSRHWETGYRFDRLWSDDQGPYAADYDPVRHSFVLAWRNSEFSLFRLQLSRDKPTADTVDNAVYMQYQTSLGAHGAHKF